MRSPQITRDARGRSTSPATTSDLPTPANPEAQSDGPETRRRRTPRWLSTLLLASVTLVLTVIGGQTAAHASQGNYNFDAYCNANHAITAWAPDLTHDGTEWTVVWSPTLFRYNGASWVRYLNGPTQVEGEGGAALNYWTVQSVAFSHIPQGYYQVRTTYSWLHNGVKTGAYGINQPVVHHLDGRSYYYGASVPTFLYSSTSYCYES